jgi:hypothetical protein
MGTLKDIDHLPADVKVERDSQPTAVKAYLDDEYSF